MLDRSKIGSKLKIILDWKSKVTALMNKKEVISLLSSGGVSVNVTQPVLFGVSSEPILLDWPLKEGCKICLYPRNAMKRWVKLKSNSKKERKHKGHQAHSPY